MERPNTTWDIFRNPPEVSPKASEIPVHCDDHDSYDLCDRSLHGFENALERRLPRHAGSGCMRAETVSNVKIALAPISASQGLQCREPVPSART